MLRLLLPLLLLPLFIPGQGTCLRGDCHTGRGAMEFPDGSRYEGHFQAARIEGYGELTYPDGSLYRGHFVNQLQDGEGELVDADGNVYRGQWRGGHRHGQGHLTYRGGGRLSGVWTRDALAGEADYTFPNQDRYRGAISGRGLNGYGTMHYANGDRYEGAWRDDRRHGRGTMYYADGSELTTKWQKGKPIIDWQSLGFRGNIATLPVCTKGCAAVQGRFDYADGTRYAGALREGVPHGKGTIFFPGGNVYYGEVRNHLPHGLGLMQYGGGTAEGGLWRQGRLSKLLYKPPAPPEPPTAAPDFDPTVRVWAVVVGCAYYEHMPSLRYTDDDAYQIYALLKSVEGGALSDEQVQILVDEQATYANIRRAMTETYARADENDVVLFYFSGHGLPGSLLPMDARDGENVLRHADVEKLLLASPSRHKLVIADACYSGSIAARSPVAGTGRLDNYYQALQDASASTALMMSSRTEEISLEDGKLRSGVFSHYLIRGMKGEADADADGLVVINELFDYVYRNVRAYTQNVQSPTLTGTFDVRMPVAVVNRR